MLESPRCVVFGEEGVQLLEPLDARVFDAVVDERAHPLVPYSGPIGDLAQREFPALIQKPFRPAQQRFG